MNQTVGLATPLIGLFLELEFQSGKVILQDVEQPVYSPISGPFSPIWTSNGFQIPESILWKLTLTHHFALCYHKNS